MNMFENFQQEELQLFHLNFDTIILLPTKENAIQIQQYRPIYLLNASFKIFIKVGTNRLTHTAKKVIKPTQMTFMPGCHILEGLLILHESMTYIGRVLLKFRF
jgi:hypothetical protein